jgi:ribonuclease HII
MEKETKEGKEYGKNNKPLIIGIDDAGRGPVIGPMCLAGVLIPREIEEEFRRAGIKDSKLLTPKKREELVEIIKQTALDFHFELLTPAEIDTGMGIGVNLNEVEAMAAANIINNLAGKLTEEQKKNLVIIIDCPSTNPNAWINTLMKYVKKENKHIKLRAEHKADFHYPSVSAASIIAKTTRDSEIEKLKKEVGFDFGSGYPADPFTKEALEKHAEELKKHRLVRESWQTWKNISGENDKEAKKGGKQTKLFE